MREALGYTRQPARTLLRKGINPKGAYFSRNLKQSVLWTLSHPCGRIKLAERLWEKPVPDHSPQS